MKLVFFLLLSLSSFSAPLPVKIAGTDLSGLKLNKIEIGQKKGLVVIFLSSRCPCSNNHIDELKKLKNDFSDFAFVGIHSNMDEPNEESLKYFTEQKLPFPVLQDENANYADLFQALKTPHSFILNNNGEILYQGGVSNSHNVKNSDKLYLREALEDILKGGKVRSPEGRTLGCFISRKKA
jgi:peroxiredoxin